MIPRRPPGGTPRESLRAAATLTLFLAAFFSTPLLRYGQVHFSGVSFLQEFSLTQVGDGRVPRNAQLGDTVLQMQPWALFNRSELSAGRFPLWNPWNGAGCPHFANYQSGVLSLFVLPFYVLGLKAALLSSAFLKLLGLGLFTFLFLRELRASRTAAICGAVALMFSGHSIFWLAYPHVGVAVILPACLFFAEKALRRLEAPVGAKTSLAGPLTGLTIALAAGWLAGHPEPVAPALVVVAAWIAVRLLGIARELRRRGRSARLLVRPAASFLGSGAIALGIASIQILPFLEYLAHSVTITRRPGVLTPLHGEFWPLALFPSVLGDPSTPQNFSADVPVPNFAELNVTYVGGTVLFLVLLGACFARRSRSLRFFLLAAAIWIAYAYDPFGLLPLVSRIPGVDLVPMNRSQGTWAFLAACAAGLALDRILGREGPPAWKACLSTALFGLAFVGVFRVGAGHVFHRYSTHVATGGPDPRIFAWSHVSRMTWIFLGGVSAVCALWIAPTKKLRELAAVGVVLVVFLGSGWTFKEYNTVTEDRLVYPVTPAIQALRDTVGADRVAVLGEDGLPSDANLPYAIGQLPSFDAMWVRAFDELYRDRFGSTYDWRPIVTGTERALEMFGVRWILAKWNWIFLDGERTWDGRPGDRPLAPVEIGPGREVSQTFSCTRDRLQALMVYVSLHPGAKPCALRARLADAETGSVVFERTMSSEEIAADLATKQPPSFRYDPPVSPPGRPLVFTFDAQERSAGRRYVLTVIGEGGSDEAALTAWALPHRRSADGESRAGGESLSGDLVFGWSCLLDDLEFARTVGDFALYRLRRSPGIYWTVRRAVRAADGPEAIELLRAQAFDPTRMVVLGPEDSESGAWRHSSRRVVRRDGSARPGLVSREGDRVLEIGEEGRLLAEQFDRWSVEGISDEEFDRLVPTTPDRELERSAGESLADSRSMNADPPVIVEETPTFVRLRVHCREEGYLVIARTHYPGWKVRVDGIERPLHRANYAFSAVELGPGANTVDLSYEPESFRWGIWIAIASVLCGTLCLGIPAFRARTPSIG